MNRRRVKTGREKDERWRKNISAPVSQEERGESRFWIQQFRRTWNQLQCTCQNSVTTPLSRHVYQKRSLSSSMHTPPTSKYSHQVAILCPSKYTKMHIIASDFSKISRGSMPPDPLAGLGLRPSFCRLYASWLVPRNIPAYYSTLKSSGKLVCCSKANGHWPFHLISPYFSSLRQLALVNQ